MSRINNIILKLPPETREKVLLLRDKYDILMKLDANTSREVARKAILLNYIKWLLDRKLIRVLVANLTDNKLRRSLSRSKIYLHFFIVHFIKMSKS